MKWLPLERPIYWDWENTWMRLPLIKCLFSLTYFEHLKSFQWLRKTLWPRRIVSSCKPSLNSVPALWRTVIGRTLLITKCANSSARTRINWKRTWRELWSCTTQMFLSNSWRTPSAPTAARLQLKDALNARINGTAPATARSNSGRVTKLYARSSLRTERMMKSRTKNTRRIRHNKPQVLQHRRRP